jgi:hypothetical protein
MCPERRRCRQTDRLDHRPPKSGHCTDSKLGAKNIGRQRVIFQKKGDIGRTADSRKRFAPTKTRGVESVLLDRLLMSQIEGSPYHTLGAAASNGSMAYTGWVMHCVKTSACWFAPTDGRGCSLFKTASTPIFNRAPQTNRTTVEPLITDTAGEFKFCPL